MRLPHLITAIVFCSSMQGGLACASDVVKSNPQKVYMHYMPWYETPDTLGSGQWGWHWRMNTQNPNIMDGDGRRQIASHFYPMIGPYASSDPDVIEYHLLLMKFSGVDGVMIDWYGVQGTNGDITNLLANSNALVDRIGDFGLDFSVVLEDRFSANIGQAEANVAYLRDNYFPRSEYVRVGDGDDPLLAVFGPITFQQETQWTQILSQGNEPIAFLPLWYESADAGANARGEYAWIYEDESQDNHLDHQESFYRYRAGGLEMAGGVAYPGFVDFYAEGGAGSPVPFEIPHHDGQTLDEVLDQAALFSSRVDFLQLATFNDFGEGTMFEPTLETGFDYLLRVQEHTGVSYGQAELELVYRLYVARREYANSAEIVASLDQVSAHLAALEVQEAETLLNAAAPATDYNRDGQVNEEDYLVWASAFGSSAILAGSGADGNYDGIVDAADYTLWRDAATQVGALAATPEPSAVLLSTFLAMAFAPHRRRS
ncbi:hypothetical protein KOR34_08430 [Posidoniimonas corsicana]|uniref:Glycosyl hydrolase family 99 n=1 Tax=Posidoniimonas corsicana TaxID=1938618 RepID=A0A5C5VBE4_9BACT|nr:hypothetical protein [Posidoniimonas corsicana]TWT35946.1 hypothetical protein KOR34_08430 [Posidoniimonas corsicana]